jgi:dCTP deaminase
MILCDHEIEAAIKSGEIIIRPEPSAAQFAPTALDIRVGSDFRRWRDSLRARGFCPEINFADLDLTELLDQTEPVALINGLAVIKPDDFVLVRTLETVHLPFTSKIAARIEGRSSAARLGMSVHVTAPTIHGGFHGKIVLEILNHGPFSIRIRPDEDCISQLIFERVSSQPKRDLVTTFIEQTTPLGTPARRKSRK